MDELVKKTYRLTPKEVVSALTLWVADVRKLPPDWVGSVEFGVEVFVSESAPITAEAAVKEVIVTYEWPSKKEESK